MATDYLLWYGRSPRENGNVKYPPTFLRSVNWTPRHRRFNLVELPDGREGSIDAVPPREADELLDYRTRPEQLFSDCLGALIYPGEQLTSEGERLYQGDPIEFLAKIPFEKRPLLEDNDSNARRIRLESTG